MAEDPAGPGEIVWVQVEHLPEVDSGRARRARRIALNAFGLYGFAVVVGAFFALLGGWIEHPIDLAALSVVLGSLGLLQVFQYRSLLARELLRDRADALGRVGSTGSTLLLEGEGRTEIPWAQVEAPELDRTNLRTPFRLPYEAPDGDRRHERLGAGELVALLQLPGRPAWSVPVELRQRIEREYRARGRTPPRLAEAPLTTTSPALG